MHGAVIPISGQRHWDFSYLGSSATESVFLARAISVVPFSSLMLFVRCHSNSIGGGAGTPKLDVIVENIYPIADDPTIFTPGSSLITAQIDTSTVVGSVVEAVPAAGNIGPWVSVRLLATQAGGTTAPIAASLSIGLLGRVN